MNAESSTHQIKFRQGGFVYRCPEIFVLGAVAVMTVVLALDFRSFIGPLFLAALWLLGMWYRFGPRRHRILVELTHEGVWVHGGSLLPPVLHGWTQISDVTVGQDQQGKPNVLLHLGHEIISIPHKLRIDRTEADVEDVLRHIQNFRQKYDPL